MMVTVQLALWCYLIIGVFFGMLELCRADAPDDVAAPDMPLSAMALFVMICALFWPVMIGGGRGE